MNQLEKRNLKEEITIVKNQNIEELILMLKYCFIAYIKSLTTFGYNSEVSKDVLQVWKEFWNIIIEENRIMNLLLKYRNIEDLEQCNCLMDSLEILNEKTVLYYYDVLEDIETACQRKEKRRAKRKKKDFDTIIESLKYRHQFCSLLVTLEDIKSFLNYPEEFWHFIEKKIIYIDGYFEENKDFYGVHMKMDEKDFLVDLKIIVPTIINLETALVNVHEFKHAYDLYQILGNYFDSNKTEFYEETARNLESKFKEKYMVKKYQQIFENL